MYSTIIPLTLTMLNMNIFYFEYSVDPGQLAFENPSDQNRHCFPVYLLRIQAKNDIQSVSWIEIGEECS